MNERAKVLLRLARALRSEPFRLCRRPRRRLEFKSAAAAADHLTLRNASMAAAPRFRVDGELDLAPDLLVVDYGLGTIGLVHCVEPCPGESLADQAKRHVDQATYLRHLLATRGVAAGTEGFPLDYTVECVLVIRQESAHELIEVVREISARTRFLHATGLNLLQFAPPFEFASAEVRRAFAWLLPVARQRLRSCKPPGARLDGLELSNFRLPGTRPWKLDQARVHLLHGPNGTGKSSIAEALELAVTGSIERIRTLPAPDYAAIIRNSDAAAAATIALSLSDGRKPAFTVVPAGVSESALQPELPVTAFRLDQTVMDHLARTDSQQRARSFTRAFFPGDAYRELEQAHEEFSSAYRELPPEVREEIQANKPDANEWYAAAIPRLVWVELPAVPADRLADCLPLKAELLEALARISPEIGSALDGLRAATERKAFEAALQRLDEALGWVRSSARAYRDAAVRSVDVLERLSDWAPDSAEVRLQYADLLDRWTDRLALGELLKNHLELTGTLLNAREAGWTPPSHTPGLLAAQKEELHQSIDALRRAAETCAREQEDFFRQLQSSVRGASASAAMPSRTSLSAAESADLNLAGSWFTRQEPTPAREPMGDAVQKAISENKAVAFGSLTIGAEGWTKRPAEFLRRLQPALNALLAFEPAPGSVSPEQPVYRSPVVRLHSFEEALASARKVAAAYARVEETLIRRLAQDRLNEALDEVIALFTPARWAYEGFLISPSLQLGKVSMKMMTARTNSQAEVRLNTAELNVVILALYLLCAPTVENPLGTLILDDPLQNMDELTAATVARGVAKIAALLPEGWQLMLMFHGEEDVETFRREVPGAVYTLPWLGPLGTNGARPNAVLPDPRGRRSAKPRGLDEVVRLDAKLRARRPAAK